MRAVVTSFLPTGTTFTPGELLIIPDIDEPYSNESCWEGIEELDAAGKDYLGNVFPKSFHMLED